MWWRRWSDLTDEERQQALEDARVEVAHLQWTAYRNFRWSVAFACMFFGVIALPSMGDGSDEIVPRLLMVAGGLVAATTFAVRSRLLLGAAVALVLAGLVWLLAG